MDIAAAAQAAATAASADPLCTVLGDFYWEIGASNAALASGAQQGGAVTATTSLPIASASKLVFGAYVLQKSGGVLDASLADGLRFVSRYTNIRGAVNDALPFTRLNRQIRKELARAIKPALRVRRS